MELCLLEDSLEQINLNMNKIFTFDTVDELMSFLKKKSRNCLLCEICALIGFEENKFIYIDMPNKSKLPNMFFYMDPSDYLSATQKYKCFCIFHSHLNVGPEPSDFDIKTSENSCLSFLIYSIMSEKFFLYEPQFKDYDVNITKGLRNYLNEY